MAMTAEKQGGSDVQANTTTAAPAGDGEWRLTGHQVVLLGPDERRLPGPGPGAGRAELLPGPAGLPTAGATASTCSGSRTSSATGQRLGEVELDGATGWLVGEPGEA